MVCPRPHDSPDPASLPHTWILSCGRPAPAPPPLPAGGGGVQRAGELAPLPGPPAARRVPPLTSAGPLRSLPTLRGSLAACGPCPCPSGASAGGGVGISPVRGKGPWARPPGKPDTGQEDDLPETSLTSLGRAVSALDPRDSGSPGRVLWGGAGVRGRGHLVPPTDRSPDPSHQALRVRLLCLQGLSCGLLGFLQVRQGHTLHGEKTVGVGGRPFRMGSRPPAPPPSDRGLAPPTPAWTSETGA